MNVCYLYQIWASMATVGLISGLSLNLHLYFVYDAMEILHICTGSTVPLLCHTAISTKYKCAGSFDLFLAFNQAKFNIL